MQRAEKKGDELLQRLRQAVCLLSLQTPGLSNEEQKLRKKLLDMQANLEKLKARMGLVWMRHGRMYICMHVYAYKCIQLSPPELRNHLYAHMCAHTLSCTHTCTHLLSSHS